MKKNKYIIFGLSLALVTSPINIFAKTFKDVTKDGEVSWAYKYIDELSNKNILNGYKDGTFKPNSPVSFLELLQIIKTVLNPSQEEISNANIKYLEIANANSVPDWAKEAVCFNLYNKTITEKTLKSARKKGFIENKIYPNRNTVATYIARALKINKSNDKSNLNYKDINNISKITIEYLPELIKSNIFSSTGSDGFFNGDLAIRRSEMAVIAYNTLKYREKEDEDVQSVFDNIATDDLIPEDNTNNNTINNKIIDIVEENPKSIFSPITDSSKNSEDNIVTFFGEILEIKESNGIKNMKVKITKSNSNKIEKDKLIYINSYKNHNVGDIVEGIATIGENSLLNIKLK